MAPPLLALQGITLGLGAAPLLNGVDLAIGRDERICLVGRNGSGKSTLLKIAAGAIDADSGVRFVQPGTRIAYLPQEPSLAGFATVQAYVAAGLPATQADELYRVDSVMDELQVKRDGDPTALSGGEARRAAIARALVSEPDLLLLDEPTNHLDLPTIQMLETLLLERRGGFVLISHDRAFLNRLTAATLWLDRGTVRRLDQGFAQFEDWAEGILAQEEVERAKFDKRIAEELAWSRQGVKARRKRNMGRVRALHAMRDERAQQIDRVGAAKAEIEAGPVSGKQVIEAKHISKTYGAGTAAERVIVRDFSTRILRGDRIGIIGPNGAGKTTLLRMLTGDLSPDSGKVVLGANLTPVTIDQKRDALDPTATVAHFLTDGAGDQIEVNGTPRHVVGYLRDWLFEGAQAQSPISALSGGERGRLLLAKALARPSNLMILDEPTNDLDIETLDLLEDWLGQYDGTLLLVSHDRDFLDRVVTSTIAVEGDGTVGEYAGGYTDYLRQRPAPVAAVTVRAAPKAAAAAPTRAASAAPVKLNSLQKRELDRLPAEIAKLETEIAKLEKILADPTLYSRAPAEFAGTAEKLTAARSKLETAEERWLEIEMLRETLAG